MLKSGGFFRENSRVTSTEIAIFIYPTTLISEAPRKSNILSPMCTKPIFEVATFQLPPCVEDDRDSEEA